MTGVHWFIMISYEENPGKMNVRHSFVSDKCHWSNIIQYAAWCSELQIWTRVTVTTHSASLLW